MTSDKFHLPQLLVANPHLYDYFHYLKFKEDSSVELADGAGQVINGDAHGNYRVVEATDSSAKVEFYDLVETNPYKKNEKIRDLESFQVEVTKEGGLFPFVPHTFARVKSEEERECLLFRERYVFETDPLSFARKRQADSLYYQLEKKDLIETARYYYPREDAEELTIKDVLALGLTKDEIWKSWQPK